MAKVKQADLKREIEAQDRKDSRKKSFNVNALRLMLAAAKGVKDSESFANAFTPTRGTNSIARKLKLGLDVVRGQWVFENGKHNPGLNRIRESNMRNVNEVVDGSKLIELLMQALEEGDTVRVSEISNQILSQKVSECLVDRRILIAERLFNEDLADLVKASNLNRDEDDSPEPEDELLPNAELANLGADEDETFDEGLGGLKFKVGDKVDVKTGFSPVRMVGTVTKVGPTRLDGVWVKSGKKTTNWETGLVRKLREGSEPSGLDTFCGRSAS